MGLFQTELRFESGEISIGPVPGSDSAKGREELHAIVKAVLDSTAPAPASAPAAPAPVPAAAKPQAG